MRCYRGGYLNGYVVDVCSLNQRQCGGKTILGLALSQNGLAQQINIQADPVGA